MFEWQKLGKIFDPADFPSGWMKSHAQSPSAVVFDDYVRVYFCTRPEPDENGQFKSYLSFVDLNKENLLDVINVCQAPILSLGEYGTFDEFGTNPVSVIRHEDELRVYYAGWTRCESVPFNAAIGVAVSHDNGETFRRLGKGPVLSYSPDEPYLLGSPRIKRINGTWHLYYVSGVRWLTAKEGGSPEPVYKIRCATSDDGVRWNQMNRNLITDVLGPNECQACADVHYINNAYHMFFSYRESHNYKGELSAVSGYRVGYAYSEDGLTWLREDDRAGLRTSDSGWDAQMVSYPNVFGLNGEYYMLYQGNHMGLEGFGVARLVNKEKAWG